MAYTTINKPTDYFNGLTYSGNNTATAYNNGLDMSTNGGWVWLKTRSATGDHGLFDSVRGINKRFSSNNTAVEDTLASNGVTSFNSTGFSLGTTAYNDTPYTFMSWSWIAGGTGVSNTVGTRTSTVSANTTSDFSIVSYTGNQTAGATIGHGLGVKPDFMIVKLRSGDVAEPFVYHKSLGATKALKWNTTDAPITNTTVWNDTEPTSTVFSVGTSNNVNHVYPLIAYCFAEVKGYSKFGSYTGNGSTDGPFIYTGFKPAMVIAKRTDSTGNWRIRDNKRSPNNVITDVLYPNSSSATITEDDHDFLSNGFKVRTTGPENNASGGTFIYMAFAEQPLVGTNNVPATAR